MSAYYYRETEREQRMGREKQTARERDGKTENKQEKERKKTSMVDMEKE